LINKPTMSVSRGASQPDIERAHQTDTFALVCLVRDNTKDRDGRNFGVKDMSETMGPCEAECPAKILDLLAPTTSEYALAWRARSRAVIARRSRPAPKDSDVIIFLASDPLYRRE
jgi:hypothetical protein